MAIDIWTLTIPATVAAIAWLYQKAWERQERRVKQYEEVLDTLPGFVASGLDPAKINQAMALGRRLWLLGPDKVIRAFDEFTSAIENFRGHEASKAALGKLILAMRKDASFASVLIPRFQTTLKPNDFEIKSASLITLPVVSASSAQINVQSSVNATIVSNGSFIIALQTAMRSAIIDNKLGKSALDQLVSKIAIDVTAATAEGFSPSDVKDGKAQTMKFVAVIADAIQRELSSKRS
jgi:hypothetical protein